MYRIERTTAFILDLIPMALLSVVLSIFVFPELSGLSFRLLAPVFPALSHTVSSTLFSFPIYNSLWMYFVFTGLMFKGSLGKRIMRLKLENKSGNLKLWDLIKRYSPLITSGLFSTALMVLFIHYHESINHQWAERLMNINFVFVPVYIIACNLLNGQSLYDKLAGTKIVKIEQNQTVLTTSEAAPPTS